VNMIPASHENRLTDATRAFASIATVMQDGSPQLTPVWFNMRGDHVLVNPAKGRVKDTKMRARPRVTPAIVDPPDPCRYAKIWGRISSIREEGGFADIPPRSLKYRGCPRPPIPDQVRVTHEIVPARVSAG
jgi:PPOX class probable F420-dependent enzyme